jgi:sialidase-1
MEAGLNPVFVVLAGMAGYSLASVAFLASAADVDRSDLTPDDRARCLEILRGALASEEFWPAMHAAEALSLAGLGEEVRVALHDRLPAETDDQRRCGLARELVRAGDRSALPTLFAILGDASSKERIHAAESLYKLAEIGDGKLLKEASGQTEVAQLQLMAAAALAKAGDGAALARLRGLLRSNDRAVKNNAAWALGLVGGPADVDPLSKLLAAETDEASRAVLACALACLGAAEGRAELGRNLQSPAVAARIVAAEFAGHAGCAEHVPRLLRMLNDDVLDARVRAAQSLLMLAGP